MITVAGHRFLERVPNLLADIERSLTRHEINWEQRRYEIAKDIACAMWLDDGQETTDSSLSINNKNQEHNE